MSLILDALHKADRERSAEEQAPNLQAIRGSPMPDSRATGRWRVLALLLAALLVGIGLFTLMRVPENDTASTRTEPASTEALAPLPAPQPAVEAAPPAAIDAAVPDAVALAEPQSSDAAATTEVESLYRASREAAPADASSDGGQDEVLVEQVPVDEVRGGSERGEYASLPSILDLRERIRDEIPSIRYTEHRYSGDASADEVVLNGASLKKGDRVTADLYLVEILDDAIVLEFRGQRFRLAKFNNWINM